MAGCGKGKTMDNPNSDKPEDLSAKHQSSARILCSEYLISTIQILITSAAAKTLTHRKLPFSSVSTPSSDPVMTPASLLLRSCNSITRYTVVSHDKGGDIWGHQNYLLKCILYIEAYSRDLLLLPNTMDSRQSLILECRVPDNWSEDV